MQGYPLIVEIIFWILSNLFFITVLVWILIFYLLVKDKPVCILVLTVIGMESFVKKFFAIVYRDPRPFFLEDYNKKCFCVFGDPSGHISTTLNAYFIFIFFFILQTKINKIVKTIIVIVYFFLIFILGWSRLYETSHFSN